MIKSSDISLIGSYIFSVDAYLCDFRGKATLPMICGFMLQAATKHAEERGFGYSEMTSNHKVWVLSRLCLELDQLPPRDTEIEITTWLNGVNRLFAERCFSLKNAKSGHHIAYAKTYWAVIDLETRKAANVETLRNLPNYVNADMLCPIDNPLKLQSFGDGTLTDQFCVKYSDVDINKHLNSMKYIEHFTDAIDIANFYNKSIFRLDVNYNNEAQLGNNITVYKKNTDTQTTLMEMKNSDTVLSIIKIEWK